MQPSRIAFNMVGGLAVLILSWLMFRNHPMFRSAPTERKPVAANNRVVGHEATAMVLDIPSELIPEGAVWWRDRAMAAGVDFQHFSGMNSGNPIPAFFGSGVAAVDFDRDGVQDLYFATGTPLPFDPRRPLPINRIYRNLGRWQFIDVTAMARLGHNGYSTGIAVGDYDNDGFSDIYVAGYGHDCLFRNMGDGTYLQVEQEAGIVSDEWSTSVAMADVDRDGLLDIYVCRYGKATKDGSDAGTANGSDAVGQSGTKRILEQPKADVHASASVRITDRLYRNLGDGTFADISVASGVDSAAGQSLAVLSADLNEDGYPDFAVTHDGSPPTLKVNRGNGTFDTIALTLEPPSSSSSPGDVGSGSSADNAAEVSKPSVEPQAWRGVTSYFSEREAVRQLFIGTGAAPAPALVRKTAESQFTMLPMSSEATAQLPGSIDWGCAAADFDLDGMTDVMSATGQGLGLFSQFRNVGVQAQLPRMLANTKGELRTLGARAGEYFLSVHVGRGLAIADLDNDGDYDAIITHVDALPAVLRNTTIRSSTHRKHSILLRLIGTRCSRDAVGAKVTAFLPGRTRQFEIVGGGSYLSASDQRIIMALNPDEAISRVEIEWPGGNRSELTNLQDGNSYTVIEPVRPEDSAVVFSRLKGS